MILFDKIFRSFAAPAFIVAIVCALGVRPCATQATWRALDENKFVTCMDFLPTGVGLVGIGGPGPRIEIWDGKNIESGVYVATSGDLVTAVKIIDSSTAWATVSNEGLYVSTTKLWGLNTWRQVMGGTNLRLLYASKSIVFITDGKILKVSSDLSTFTAANGIPATDTVNAIDQGDGSIFVATTGTHIYRSGDGGKNWSLSDSVLDARSVFYDGIVKAFFVGGDTVRKSTDFGASWISLVSPNFDVSGQVVGTYDCSGTFYVSTYISNFVSAEHNTVLRSQDHGETFQNVGRAFNSTIHFQQGRSFDRGTQFYWLDPVDGYVTLSNDGVDGSLPWQVAPDLIVKPDSSILSDECSHQVTSFHVSLSLLECVGVHVDSIKILSGVGTVALVSYKLNVLEGTPAILQMTYQARAAGTDSVQARLWFHNTETSLSESKDFLIVGTGTSDPAKLSVNSQTLDFGQVKVDSQKTLTFILRNIGCDPMQVDSVVSSNSPLFTLDQHPFPITLQSGDSLKVKVTFFPTTLGEEVEAIEYGSSAGHGFVELRGTGVTTVVSSVSDAMNAAFAIFPNPVRDLLTVRASAGIGEVELIDAIGRSLTRLHFDHPLTAQVDMRAFPAGAYFIRVDNNRPLPILLLR